MREHPILFSTDMVKAILGGNKTQTRRVMKNQPVKMERESLYGRPYWYSCKQVQSMVEVDAPEYEVGCPYGQVGDRLWVRETWAAHEYYDGRKPSDIPEGVTIECSIAPDAVETEGNGHRKIKEGERGKWRPSIFMPRWASRITLEITEVRVERVQEITGKDAVKEGVYTSLSGGDLPIVYFKDLWDSLNAKRGYGWDANPWVWVISFKVSK